MKPSWIIERLHTLVSGRRVLINNFGWLMGLRVIQQVLGLIGVYFLARLLSMDTFGSYGFLLSTLAICTIFTLPGLNNVIAQGAARGALGIYRRAVGLSLSGSILGSLICLGSWLYFKSIEPDLALAFLLAALLFPVSHGLLQWQSVLTGREKFSTYFWLGTVGALLTYVSMVVGLHFFPDEILVPVFAVIGTPALLNTLLTMRMLRHVHGESAEQAALPYGLKSSFYLAINTIANHLDKLLLFYLLSAESVALFMVGERLSELAKNVIQDFTAVLMPYFARMTAYTNRLDRQLKTVGLIFTVGLLLFTFTFLPWLLVTIFSERYVDAVPIAQGLMVSVAVGIHATLRARYVTAKLDGLSVRDIYVTISIIRIILTCLLVPLFGLWGAVASAICYRIFSAGVVHIIVARRYLPG